MNVNLWKVRSSRRGPAAEIYPLSFEAQLTIMEGQMARDQALLENARLDLQRYRVLWARFHPQDSNSIPRRPCPPVSGDL